MVRMPYSLRKYTSPHILQACGVVLYSKPTKSSDNEVMRDFCQNQSASISLFAIAASVDFSGSAASLRSSFKNSS